MSKEQDPLDPESDIFWEGPEAIRQNLQKSSASTEGVKPYSLKPQAAVPGPSVSSEVINTNTTLNDNRHSMSSTTISQQMQQ